MYWVPTFEQGFSDTERAAISAVKASSSLVAAAKQMQKVAQEGDIAKIRKTSERLTTALDAVRQEVANARDAWPFTPEAEEVYLRDEYERELLDVAGTEGLQIRRYDERLVVFPSVIRILPTERAVKIDRNRVPTIRPSKLVATLKANQTKKPKFASERFLESLYRAYRLLAGSEGVGTTVALYRIYEAFTLQPGATSEYNQSDFGRGLFLLDRSGLTQTKSGAEFSFPASTSLKGAKAKEVFSFVAPDGETVTYYGIRFMESNQ